MGYDGAVTEREITPLAAPPDATVELPGSKSITNRCLLAAALAEGRSHLRRVLIADDTEAMLDCIAALGARTVLSQRGASVEVLGIAGRIPTSGSVSARQSGTTARFVAPVLALALGPWRLDGDPQLQARPMEDLFSALRELGASVDGPEDGRALPAVIRGPIDGHAVSVAGDVSSQFLSGVLQAAPLTARGLEVSVRGDLVSRPYVSLTLATMREFGAEIEEAPDHYSVSGGGYRAATVDIEPDASAASYFLAAAAVARGRVRIPGLGTASVQGDLRFAEVLEAMGAELRQSEHATELSASATLHGITVDARHISDTVPTIAVVAACAEGQTEITGIGFIRNKESDRISAVVNELRRCGVVAEERPDGMVIHPGGAHGALVHTYGDHRIAMAFSILGLVVPGVRIEDPGCVAKTFPEFFDVLETLRHP